MKAPVVCVASLVVPWVGLAQTPPPPHPFEAMRWPATMRSKPASGITLGNLSLTFEHQKLEDVRVRSPGSKISHQGDAGESMYWLCFTLANPPARLWITSHGEMGGPDHAITGVSLSRMKRTTPSSDCPHLPQGLQPVKIGAPVNLGTTEVEVVRKLHAPSYRSDGWWSYDFLGKRTGACSEGFEVMNWLVIGFADGAVETISAGQVTSC